MARITLDTRDYELAHGKKPRGDGNWAFRRPGVAPDDFDNMVWIYGTITQAKAKLAPGTWIACS